MQREMERVLIQVHLIFVLMTIIYRLSIDTQLNFVERICVLPCFSVVAIRLNFITQNDNIFPFPTCCSMLWLHHHQKQQLELIMCTVQKVFPLPMLWISRNVKSVWLLYSQNDSHLHHFLKFFVENLVRISK